MVNIKLHIPASTMQANPRRSSYEAQKVEKIKKNEMKKKMNISSKTERK